MKKEEFLALLEEAQINKKEFAHIANISYHTVVNWGVARSGKVLEIPNWVKPFLHYYLKAQKFDYVAQEICQKLTAVKEG